MNTQQLLIQGHLLGFVTAPVLRYNLAMLGIAHGLNALKNYCALVPPQKFERGLL
jgi:hypothetical protein